ncbi:N-acetylmuramoyl-L-alanine amidase [Desulfotalea psychrophila]|nr:N-acetylmuramoyl-L-alanine amidase [Desulfocapsa sp.]MBN4064017.1 N-acetylmuramoyl-L-alanine amidase [bacterium AH-315-I07]MBN4071569.1 N-acetylmuramoyl-L-alanine amidase [Desulfotalea psychrophila]
MVRSFPVFILLLLLIAPFSADFCPAAEAENAPADFVSLEQQYQQAKLYYNELHTNNTLGKLRDNWLNGVRTFRKIYLSGPKSDFAAPSLYMLGRMYAKMHKRFKQDIDLDESISYYRDVSDLFPENNLADDALYTVGNLYLQRKNNPQKAATSYSRVIAEYRNGDMYALASNKLKTLSKENEIPLPGGMFKRTYLKNLTNVLPVKYWSSDNYSRVVIKTSRSVRYRERLLEKINDKPRRLYIDFQESYIDPKYQSPVPINDGLLKQIRTAQFTPEVVRMVLDIESISDYKIFSLPDPFRVIIDVRGESKVASKKPGKSIPEPPVHINSPVQKNRPTSDENLVSDAPATPDLMETIIVLEDFKKTIANSQQSTKSPPSSRITEELITGKPLSLAQQLGLGVRKIVIDPGHGGKDPGASAFGLKEKDIVLKIAKKLAPILEEQTGAEVILTRESDIFIPLEERTAIANASEADLFISIHINAHPSPKVHGLETYYLNLSTDAEAMRVAAFENATSTHQMSELQGILSDIMKNSKINESARLAGFVHNSLYKSIEGIQPNNFKNLGVKQAPFYVLIGAEMPAILLELAFITNPKDSANLKSDVFLDTITSNIVKGVKNYIHSTTASLQSATKKNL